MSVPFERGEAGVGWSHGRVGNVLFLTYQTAAPEYAVDRSFDLIQRGLARHPAGVALVGVFGERVPVPTGPALQKLASQLAQYAPRVVVGSTVVEGESMSALVKRAAVAMMTSILKPGYPHKTVRSVALACDFVASKAVDDTGAPLSQGALFMAATAMRATRLVEPQNGG